jgi:hypothetical protein
LEPGAAFAACKEGGDAYIIGYTYSTGYTLFLVRFLKRFTYVYVATGYGSASFFI